LDQAGDNLRAALGLIEAVNIEERPEQQ